MKHLLDPKRESEIAQRYLAGEGSTLLARSFNVSVSTICNTLARLGVTLRQPGGASGRGRPKALSADQEILVASEYATGQSQRALAEAHGVHAQTVSNALKHRNTEKRQPTGAHRTLSADTEARLAVRRYEGASLDALAEEFDISKSGVRVILKRHGVSSSNDMHTGKKALVAVEEDQIVARYSGGESARAISQDFVTADGKRVHVQTIHNTLRRRGVSVRPDLAKHQLDIFQREMVVKACLDGLNVPTVAKQFGVSEATVTRILRAYRKSGGIVEMPIGKPRTYTVDESAFDVLTPEALYWAGFLFADGCISKDNYLICVLAEKDHTHLEKLRAFLGSTHPIRPVPKTKTSLGGPFSALSIRSDRYATILKKVWNGRLKPDRVPGVELRDSRDFWRGVLDGDGSLGYNGHYPYIQFSGHASAINEASAFIRRCYITSLNVVPTSSGIFRIETGGSTGAEIIRVLYEQACTALERKNICAQKIIRKSMESAPYTEGPASITFDEDKIVSVFAKEE